MSKTIEVQLNSRSIKQAIEDLKAYKDELHKKNELFVSKLLEKGIETAQEKVVDNGGSYGTHTMGRTIFFRQEVASLVNGASGKLIGEGETWEPEGFEGSINTLLALEFGTAGKALAPVEMFGGKGGKGTNSHAGHENDDFWFVYIKDENGKNRKVKFTAIEPTQPMYNASIRMIQDITSTAREVFGNV